MTDAVTNSSFGRKRPWLRVYGCAVPSGAPEGDRAVASAVEAGTGGGADDETGETANRELLARVRVLRDALLPFARIGRTVTAEMAAADASGWLAHARRAAEVVDGKPGEAKAA